ncbi:MAG: hypothetical protein VYD87_18460 [Pseudomonadota bacterium]|nr:hypothetical protein [Pseudomonadota bacterium]MEE3099748.1 hypothetical protein [Pseudomonadota bacterium]
MTLKFAALLGGVLICAAETAVATVVYVPLEDSGYVGANNMTNYGLNNVFAGSLSGVEYRSFFGFDLAPYHGLIATTASIAFPAGYGTFYSPQGGETVQLWDVTTPYATLVGLTSGNPALATVFADLGGGTLYAQATVTGGSGPMPAFGASFSASNGGVGLSAINAAISAAGRFLVGARLSTLQGASPEGMWFNSPNALSATYLVLNLESPPDPDPEPEPTPAVPTPPAGALLAGALGAILAGRALFPRRRNPRAA